MLSLRRLFGIMLGATPFLTVLCFSFVDWRLELTIGYFVFAFGGFLCMVNFYLSFLRYPIHRLFGGKDAEYQWVSGIPLFGILSVLGLVMIPKSGWLSLLALLFLLIDTGGIQWFVIATWKDDSLWNPKKYDIEKNIGEEKVD